MLFTYLLLNILQSEQLREEKNGKRTEKKLKRDRKKKEKRQVLKKWVWKVFPRGIRRWFERRTFSSIRFHFATFGTADFFFTMIESKLVCGLKWVYPRKYMSKQFSSNFFLDFCSVANLLWICFYSNPGTYYFYRLEFFLLLFLFETVVGSDRKSLLSLYSCSKKLCAIYGPENLDFPEVENFTGKRSWREISEETTDARKNLSLLTGNIF